MFSVVVGPSGLEPPTLRLSVVRSSQLSYGPMNTSLSLHTIACTLKIKHCKPDNLIAPKALLSLLVELIASLRSAK